jgi:outer membrane immunogenic protein
MKTIALGALASLLMMSAASVAADAVVYDAAPEAVAISVYDWSGFYVGVHGGYGTGENRTRSTLVDGAGDPLAPTANNSFDIDGFLGGVQAGFNMQMDRFVFGVEGEYSVLDVEGDFNFDPARPEAIAGGSLEAIAAIKARVGVAFDRTMIFGVAGYAVGWNEGFANNVFDPAPAEDVATGDETIDGYVVGIGVEHAFTDKLSLKGEYNYYGFGRGDFDMESDAYPAGVVLNVEPKLSLNIFKIGLNYNF